MKRPRITEFMGDGFKMNTIDMQYLENIELWNYTQALDAFCNILESKLFERQEPSTAAVSLDAQAVNQQRELLFSAFSWLHGRDFTDDSTSINEWVDSFLNNLE